MSVNMTWDNDEQTIIRYIIGDPWTWDELYEAIQQAHLLIDAADHSVHSIIDMSGAHILPRNPLMHGKKMSRGDRLSNAGKIVFVGANVFLRSLMDVFRRVHPTRLENIAFVATLDEARALLAEVARQPSAPAESDQLS
jgi:hypothetical protein